MCVPLVEGGELRQANGGWRIGELIGAKNEV